VPIGLGAPMPVPEGPFSPACALGQGSPASIGSKQGTPDPIELVRPKSRVPQCWLPCWLPQMLGAPMSIPRGKSRAVRGVAKSLRVGASRPGLSVGLGSVRSEQVFGGLRRRSVRVLGVDPGLTRCGFGMIEGSSSRPPVLLDVGIARAHAWLSLGERLMVIAAAVDDWLIRYEPDVLAVERVFAQHNVRTVMGTAQASAVAVLAATRRGLPVALHTPSEVKAAVTGNGRADKAQVATMVSRVLQLSERPRPADATDALALAICQLWRGSAQARIDAARADKAGVP
jgi:crossover junction endodeoxyribonuclease RuvC